MLDTTSRRSAAELTTLDRMIFRWAAIASVAFFVVASISQLAHPLPDADEEDDFLEEINAAASYWEVIHLTSLATSLLLIFMVFGVAWSMTRDAARILGFFAAALTVVGTAFVFSWIAIDGVAITRIAADWEAASGADKETAFRIAAAIEDIIFGYFSLAWVIWFGLPVTFLGLAFLADRGPMSRFGWIGVPLGLFATAVGVTQAYTHRDFVVTDILIPISAFSAGIWLISMTLWLWRRTRTAAPSSGPDR